MRLIDADELKWQEFEIKMEHYFNPIAVVEVADIDKCPTVDAVVVVRCDECKNRNTAYCPLADWTLPCKSDYCSYGKRRESEDA